MMEFKVYDIVRVFPPSHWLKEVQDAFSETIGFISDKLADKFDQVNIGGL